jgi:hypothetical protein
MIWIAFENGTLLRAASVAHINYRDAFQTQEMTYVGCKCELFTLCLPKSMSLDHFDSYMNFNMHYLLDIFQPSFFGLLVSSFQEILHLFSTIPWYIRQNNVPFIVLF